jgi:phosphoribosylglycinamide formyltransferase 2
MTEPTDHRPVVMLLSTGAAGRDLVLAFERLGAVAHTVNQGADVGVINSWIDEEKPAYVVADSADISTDVLIAAAEHAAVEVFPTPRGARLSLDREGLRRLAADELGLPTVPFWFAGSEEELAAVAQHAGFPLVVTPVAGPPAEGQSVLTRQDDVEPAWHRASPVGTRRAGCWWRPSSRSTTRSPCSPSAASERPGRRCSSANRSATGSPTAARWRHGSRIR